jgi:4-amino-4-deoxy-L-arabinose transferase-like glycosyltransferase
VKKYRMNNQFFNSRKLIIIICVGALGMGLIYTFIIYPHITNGLSAEVDPDRFGVLAENIYLGNGFVFERGEEPTTYKGPIYPLFLTIIMYLSFDYKIWAIQIAQNILHLISCYFVYIITKNCFNQKTALLSSLIFAIHPFFLWFLPRIWIETFITFLTLSLIIVILEYLKKESLFIGALVGILLGILALTKSVAIFLPLPVMILFILAKKKTVNNILQSLAILIIAITIIVPWTIRNYKVSNKFIPVHTSGSINFIIGDSLVSNIIHYPLSHGVLFDKGHNEVVNLLKRENISDLHDSVVERKLAKDVGKRIIEHPLSFLKKILIQMITFWYLGETPLKTVTIIIFNIPFVILGIMGLKSSLSQEIKVEQLVLIVFIFYFWLIYACIYAIARFSVNIFPIMIFYSAHYLIEWYGKY